MSNKSTWEVLSHININEKTEKKDKLTYLSWAWAWTEVQKHYPAATYEICRNEQGLPYIYDPLTGFMVFTKVTIDGITHEMWLPVMDGKNKAMKAEPYTYTVFDKYKNANIEKTVDAATMFDINKTLMRCLTKNLAMFGLGMYIYAGEDLPEAPVPTAEEIIETIKIAENIGDIQAWMDYGINTYPARKSDFEEAARRDTAVAATDTSEANAAQAKPKKSPPQNAAETIQKIMTMKSENTVNQWLKWGKETFPNEAENIETASNSRIAELTKAAQQAA